MKANFVEWEILGIILNVKNPIAFPMPSNQEILILGNSGHGFGFVKDTVTAMKINTESMRIKNMVLKRQK